MSKGESYHPDLIRDVLNETIPKELKHLIKPYHKSKWKVNKPVYIGAEYYSKISKKSYKNQYLKSIARERMYRLKKELTKSSKKLIKTKGFEKRIIQQVKKSARYIEIQLCCEILGIKKLLLMQIQSLHNARQCTPEVYIVCNKRRKNQLTTHEVFTIKKMLQDIHLMAWPVTRLHLLASKNGIVSASYNSWLYIKKLFEIERSPIKRYSMKNKIGIRKNQPNALIHSDVCRFVLKLNKKVYLFLSMCNFSKYIINAIIAEKKDKTINIKHFIDTMKLAQINSYPVLEFMTDSGSENTNFDFTKVVEEYDVSLLLAQTAITPPSNSMIERMFASIRKYIRVKYKNIELTIQQLKNSLNDFIRIHNFELPLYNIRKTPSEIYWQVPKTFNFNKNFSLAIHKRKLANSKLACVC